MKKFSITQLTLLFVAVATLFSACKSEESLTLKFSPDVSKKYEMSMNYVQNMEMGEMGSMQNTIGMTYDLLIKEKDADKNTVILTTFKKITMETKSPQGNISYNSDDKTEPEDLMSGMMAKVFNGMIGESVSMTVNPEGKVTDVKGMAAIFDKMIKSMGLDTIPSGAQMVAQFKQQFSDEQFKKNFGESFNILPNKEVKIGDSWDITSSSEMMGMDTKTKNTYTLKEIQGDVAVLNVVSDFNLDKGDSEGVPGEMKMEGTQTGTVKVNINTGLTVEGEIKQDITSTSKMMGQEIPMKIDGKVVITSKEVK